jgi:hypothetical protein
MRSFTRSPCSSATLVNPLAALRPCQKHGFDHADDRFNRAGATRGVRGGFKFRQFEPNEFVRAGKFTPQPTHRRRV